MGIWDIYVFNAMFDDTLSTRIDIGQSLHGSMKNLKLAELLPTRNSSFISEILVGGWATPLKNMSQLG